MSSPLRFSLLALAWLAIFGCSPDAQHDDVVTISIVGTNDVHGQLGVGDESGGLVGISAYVNALRAVRAQDGGAVLVVDAGDMWQGTLESNLSEGSSMVAAYNALGVAAAAIGNHEFDFGPAGPKPVPVDAGDDPRGALKQRAREASFPLLAANLIDNATGRPVAWDNVRGSTVVEVAGLRIGIIGVSTMDTLRTTIAANTRGLSMAPLVETITREAAALRNDGAALVIVVAHAGGHCRSRTDSAPTGHCDLGGELAAVANGLDPGAVDHIFGGHVGNRMAEQVNGISLSINPSNAQSFGRVDFRVDRQTGRVVERRLFPPQANPVAPPPDYEDQALVADAQVSAIAGNAAALADELQNEPVGIVLEAPFPLTQDMESALFNLVTEALLDSFEVDVALHNVRGGLRAGLPAGELTFGDVYEMFPFDNVITIMHVSGADLRRVIAAQSQLDRRAGFAGMRVFVECARDGISVRMLRPDGRAINDADEIALLTNDYLALGGDAILTPIIPPGGLELRYDQPRTRDALLDWMRKRGGSLDPAEWRSDDAPKWNLAESLETNCQSAAQLTSY